MSAYVQLRSLGHRPGRALPWEGGLPVLLQLNTCAVKEGGRLGRQGTMDASRGHRDGQRSLAPVETERHWDSTKVWYAECASPCRAMPCRASLCRAVPCRALPRRRRGPLQAGTREANRVSSIKFTLLQQSLQMGYHTLITDMDLVYIKNPFDHLYRDADIEASSDGFDDVSFGRIEGIHDPSMGWGGGGLFIKIFTWVERT